MIKRTNGRTNERTNGQMDEQTEGTLCHDLPDDVKKVLFQLIARSAVGYERTQYNRSKGESAAGDKAHIEEIFCGWGDD